MCVHRQLYNVCISVNGVKLWKAYDENVTSSAIVQMFNNNKNLRNSFTIIIIHKYDSEIVIMYT